MLLGIAYFPPVSWFTAALRDLTLSADGVIPSVATLEACEHYQKQTYRNRCRIMTAGGVENLQFPVVHDDGLWTAPITTVKVDYSTPWVVRHERAIATAYESSPFFIHYKDAIFEILESELPTLWELDHALIVRLTELMGLPLEFRSTTEYRAEAPDDFRGIHPKHPGVFPAKEEPYYHVFSGKYGFQKDLSILDLLFCEGPMASDYIFKNAIRG